MKEGYLKLPLKIRVVTPETGQPYVAMTDADGVFVAGQRATTLECSVEELPIFTAQFVVDGEDLILGQ